MIASNDVSFADWRVLAACVAAGLAIVIFAFRRRIGEEPRANDARFRSLMQANIIGIGFWSFDGQVHEANDKLLRIFGVKREDLPQWRWTGTSSDSPQPIDAAALDQLRTTGRCETYEKECIRPDGSRCWVHVAPAVIDSGGMNVVFVTDVTERIAARRELERAHQILVERVAKLEGIETEALLQERAELDLLARRLAAANEALEMFSYSVSHDLRAPLRAIDGFSRELELSHSEQLDGTGRRYLERIRANTQRMSQLIDDLLDLARLSARPIRRATIDLSAIAREVAAELGAPHVEVQPDLTVNGDPHLVRMVLHNLIDNAVKFSAREPSSRVEVFANGNGTIAVRDNGVGFDMQYAGRLFAPFQRLHSSSAFEGTGIGLALVQRIITRHGGTIRADSAPGQGATFSFNLGESR